VYSPTGHILYRRSPTNSGVWALPFSLADLKTRGEPFLVAAGGRDPSASANGTILYLPESPTPPGRLSWVDREGANVGQIGEAREMRPAPALSPDGTRVAVPENNDGKWDLWLYDLERDTRTRLTSDGSVVMASWVPDGQSLVFESHPTGRASVLRRVAADGSGEVEDLAPGRGPTVSKNGAFVLFWRSIGGQDADLFYRPFEEGGEPVVLRAGDTVDAWPRLSPDGRLVAYVSHSGGEWQVFLTRFPSGEGRWQVTTEGGRWPRWSADGRSLFFAQQDALFEVPVTDGTEVHLGRARLLFTRAPLSRSGHVGGFDVSSDGQRFLIVEPESSVAPERSVVIVLNWVPGLGPGS
jgi:Tol biopolymer transport system component